MPGDEEEETRLDKTGSDEIRIAEEEAKKKAKVRWSDYVVFELVGEFATPCVASQPLLLSEETDEKGRKVISQCIFPRDERGKAYFPPGWVAGMMEEMARRDFWKLAPMLKATRVRTTLPPETILELFKERRFAGYYVQQLWFIECETLGDASPVVQRFATSYKDKTGKETANIFDAETFQTGTQFKLKIIAPKIFEWHIQTLLEIGGTLEGIGPRALRRKDYGRFKVLSFKRVETN